MSVADTSLMLGGHSVCDHCPHGPLAYFVMYVQIIDKVMYLHCSRGRVGYRRAHLSKPGHVTVC